MAHAIAANQKDGETIERAHRRVYLPHHEDEDPQAAREKLPW